MLNEMYALCISLISISWVWQNDIDQTIPLWELFKANDKIALETYFSENKDLILSHTVVLHHPSKEGQKCSFFYVALLHNHYQMALALCDKGYEITKQYESSGSDYIDRVFYRSTTEWSEKELFIQRAIENDFQFNNKHINNFLKTNPRILGFPCIFATVDGCSRQEFTPLQYAEVCKNENAIRVLHTALQKRNA